MTVELWCLVMISLWTVVLAYTPLIARMLAQGPVPGSKWGFGNRAETPEGAAWVQRADRALRNHLENLPLFIVLVLVGHVTGHRDATTALACEVFLAARVAHSLVYMAGIAVLRTLVFWVSLGAEAVLLWKLFG